MCYILSVSFIYNNYEKIPLFYKLECGHEINLEDSKPTILSSPGYPLPYEEFYYCSWTVTAATEGQRVLANFRDFNIQRVDFLYIGVELENPKALRYTGDHTPPDIVSSNQKLYISFQSDAGTVDQGFSIALSSTDKTGRGNKIN